MTFPDRDVAVAWVGRTVVDREGVEIGACTAVFADDATAVVEWVCAEVDGVAAVIPAGDADGSDGQVQVAVRQADVASAPPVSGSRHISEDEEAALYRHYGIPASRAASPSTLPTDGPDPSPADGPEPGTADGMDLGPTDGPDLGTADGTDLGTDLGAAGGADLGYTDGTDLGIAGGADLGFADGADTGAAAGSDGAPAAAERPRWYPPFDDDELPAPARSRRGLLLAAGGLAGLALAAAAVLRGRGSEPATWTRQLTTHGRAASAAVTARTGQAAATAAPRLRTAKLVVLSRGAELAAAVAAALGTAARREAAETPDGD